MISSRPQRNGLEIFIVVHHGVIESGVPFLQKAITVDKMLDTVRNVLDRVG